MNRPIPGYPTPALDPDANEVRADPDEENPNELTLDASEVNEALPLLPHAVRRREGTGRPAAE